MKVALGLSGGVDSAVSAWLLKEQGHAVCGFFMKNWEGDDDGEYCPANEDFVAAAAAADVLGIELEFVNFAAEYRQRVFDCFLAEYRAGRTPNPDILCNSEIKFRAFLDEAERRGFAQIAMGHYARRAERDGQAFLLKGRDANKDQSYFLHRLTQAQLQRALFPVGDMTKHEVRALAERIGLPNAARKDSTGICFIGERPMRAFLQRYLPNQPGEICDPSGRVIGQHPGLAFLTIGQRSGLGIGGLKGNGAEHHSWYAARKDPANNRLWAVSEHDHPWLWSREIRIGQIHWIAAQPPSATARLSAKIRYRQTDAACTLEATSNGGAHLRFEQPQWAAAPGQSAVLYDGEICLGGGVIEDALPLSAAAPQ